MKAYTSVVPQLLFRGRLTNRTLAITSLPFPANFPKPINGASLLSQRIKGVRQASTSKGGRSRGRNHRGKSGGLSADQILNTDPFDIPQGNVIVIMSEDIMAARAKKRIAQEAADAEPKKEESKGNQKKARKRERAMGSGTADEVLAIDVQNLINKLNEAEKESKVENVESVESVEGAEKSEEVEKNDAGNSTPATGLPADLPQERTEIDVEVMELSSTGDGLAVQKGSKRVYVVPFAIPGDTVRVKVYRHLKEENYTVADFISVVKPSPDRDDSRVKCKYFSKCSGCQFQMLDYADQLQLKKRIVEKAFRNFSQLPFELIPAIQDTIGSPLQYGYRTKLTPHFDGPTGWRRGKQPLQKCPSIGFMQKGKRDTVDIEDCPIGTDAVRQGMKRERERMAAEFGNYLRGATILLRETTRRVPKKLIEAAENTKEHFPPLPADAIRVEGDEYTDLKMCITDNNSESTEYVGPYVFHNPAGSFFQNNNSILPVFTDYIRQQIHPPSSSSSSPPTPSTSPEIKYLIDAYSGSGLFTITLSSLVPGGSVGIDIADTSIAYASRNARANNLSADRVRFLAADATALFANDAVASQYPADQTVVVLDPPRKGCDADFLRQLLDYAPRRVVYVSCNVHTQARDIGVLVRGETAAPLGGAIDTTTAVTATDVVAATTATTEQQQKKKTTRYTIESVRGFDFFPQTGHVEGVAVLNRVDE
ncbi:S-adenosyl-L-methionine-dependent methyltransferase [Hypoxylon fragiforme]|uniref:S-adenosyl-L-methionine-dependent methyltransferase n=1 Tax=Hypoxylon fragiforme TaxID=63214 RepID=UPI0020C6AC93|nr:S-adenosyl-L-methionine-dependent methyltransferase [Hypoxylon fragiforme]KAI2610696.1 S-adenosyl-L-methionine-dependent methyltransferase [Hypoxylon fragiforme]